MAGKARSFQLRSRGNFSHILLLNVFAGIVCGPCSGHIGFTPGISRWAQSPLGRHAEPAAAAEKPAAAPAPSPEPSSSVALVVLNDENVATTASILAGLAGALLGGVWIGGALFAAGAYLSRKDDDVSLAFKGVASSALNALNFGANLNQKYEVTDKIGGALSGAVAKAKESVGENETAKKISDAVDKAGEVVSKIDQDTNIGGTVGNVVSATSEFAAEAVERVVDVNEEYKVTEQIVNKGKEVVSQLQAPTQPK
mmetsp:Transcript_88341/g.175653  ORF Transcript_88341/g.175653 Transcript_88341/m.175653 type:complete len:255 (-) Transcript_88341:223-987(-)|eukprot:CAMPEP_0172790782 /NCGR_PEP_ID=MMETSP1074-20121228/208139_1 /TAXON_ID=2916 /ORGANISM="Ceratium fusus, Strain PA161109" /LENGTH=254 /DNA_ID=CAMNT_0013627835 /DNA_START=72 /DNA_END=836 /DNA_ORIENTATION=+